MSHGISDFKEQSEKMEGELRDFIYALARCGLNSKFSLYSFCESMGEHLESTISAHSFPLILSFLGIFPSALERFKVALIKDPPKFWPLENLLSLSNAHVLRDAEKMLQVSFFRFLPGFRQVYEKKYEIERLEQCCASVEEEIKILEGFCIRVRGEISGLIACEHARELERIDPLMWEIQALQARVAKQGPSYKSQIKSLKHFKVENTKLALKKEALKAELVEIQLKNLSLKEKINKKEACLRGGLPPFDPVKTLSFEDGSEKLLEWRAPS